MIFLAVQAVRSSASSRPAFYSEQTSSLVADVKRSAQEFFETSISNDITGKEVLACLFDKYIYRREEVWSP